MDIDKNLQEEVNKFHLPRWNEFPSVDLYLDQVVCLLEDYLVYYMKNDNEKNDKVITKTMINNYVKHKVLRAPVNKKYNREHLASLFVIFILKQVYSINEIKMLIDLTIKTYPINQAYDRFCNELEKAIRLTFKGKSYIDNTKLSHEQYLLRNVVLSVANKLYAKKVFLKS